MIETSERERIAIIGSGKVGTAVGRLDPLAGLGRGRTAINYG